MAWKCNCGAINSGIQLPLGDISNYHVHCAADTTRFQDYNRPVWSQPQTKPDNVKHFPITWNDLDITTISYLNLRIQSLDRVIQLSSTLGYETMSNEDLFKKFYNDEKVLVSEMSSEDFRLHEEELALIAFEAKARLQAIVDHKREQNQKLRTGQKEWLVNRTDAEDQLVSDAINNVQARKKRMNKAEKLEQQLKEMNIYTDEEIRNIMGNIHRNATEKQMNLTTFVSKKTEERKEELKEEVKEQAQTEVKPIDLDLF